MSDWTELLEHLSETGNLSKSCRELGITRQTFLRAVDADTQLADRYARARADGLDAEADRALSEAISWEEDPALGRLALDARKWYLSKLASKKYGDKIETVHSGSVEVTTKEQRDAAVLAASRADK